MTIAQECRRMQWVSQHFAAVGWHRAWVGFWADKLLDVLWLAGLNDTANFRFSKKGA